MNFRSKLGATARLTGERTCKRAAAVLILRDAVNVDLLSDEFLRVEREMGTFSL